ncbi:hypothetical protein BC830DRAFT_840482 [Chytriomyces sp. MP71]|nr:hypothetical protein BC830DRAFT_840482 [Chytriomyces sp. MP71]
METLAAAIATTAALLGSALLVRVRCVFGGNLPQVAEATRAGVRAGSFALLLEAMVSVATLVVAPHCVESSRNAGYLERMFRVWAARQSRGAAAVHVIRGWRCGRQCLGCLCWCTVGCCKLGRSVFWPSVWYRLRRRSSNKVIGGQVAWRRRRS